MIAFVNPFLRAFLLTPLFLLSLATSRGAPIDKEVKSAAENTVEKTRNATLKSLEPLALAETMKASKGKNIDPARATVMMRRGQILATDAKAAGEDADLAFRNLQALVKSTATDKHYAYQQAVERFRHLCTKNIDLWMLASKQRDLTDKNDSEAYKKATTVCNAIKEFARESALSGFYVPNEFKISD